MLLQKLFDGQLYDLAHGPAFAVRIAAEALDGFFFYRNTDMLLHVIKVLHIRQAVNASRQRVAARLTDEAGKGPAGRPSLPLG
jgi:hypothetical protein